MNESQEHNDDKPAGSPPTLVRRVFGEKFGWPIALVIGIALLVVAFDGHEKYLGGQSYLVGMVGLFFVFTSGIIALDYFIGTVFGSRKIEVETGESQTRSIPHGCAVALLILVSGGILTGIGGYIQKETGMENLGIVMIGVGFLAALYSFQHAGQSVFDGTGRFLWKFSFGRGVIYVLLALIAVILVVGTYSRFTEEFLK